MIISNDCFKEYNLEDMTLIKFIIQFEEFITFPEIEKEIEKMLRRISEEINMEVSIANEQI